MKNLIAHFLERVLERVLEREGTAHIAAIISVVGAAITLGGILFGFGGRMANIESATQATRGTAETAIIKADSALQQTANLAGKEERTHNGRWKTNWKIN